MVKPPANALNVIAVGGINDENQLDDAVIKAYHSTYGKTIDELMKPELVAHAIWIAAPILPHTNEAQEAAALYKLANTSIDNLKHTLAEYISRTSMDSALLNNADIVSIQSAISGRIMNTKFISAAYMHVDGTSFAAPIVCSVIAQLLEANPLITPAEIRRILFSTSRRIETIEAVRQGYGIIQPRKALLKVLNHGIVSKEHSSPYIDVENKTIAFYIRNDCAQEIALAGSFNDWSNDSLLMAAGYNGQWKIEIPMLPQGKYAYKFLVDNKLWVEDSENPFREFDSFNGFNSILHVNN